MKPVTLDGNEQQQADANQYHENIQTVVPEHVLLPTLKVDGEISCRKIVARI
jgi:hypothetical protein